MIQKTFSVLVIATSLTIVSCGDQNSTPPPPPPVAIGTYEVKPIDAIFYTDYPATIAALNEVQIRPQVTGYITGIYFKDGQQVSKGMKLYTIDQQQYLAGYDQSIANLNVAKANLEKAQQDANRYLELQKQDAIAKQVVDHALADLQAAKMQVAAAQANVRNVQTGLRYATIYSPLSGTIGISQVKLGAAVTPGVTVLNTVSADNPMAVDIAVDEKQITQFTKLQQQAQKDDSTFKLVMPDQSIYPYYGKIYLIDRAVDPTTGTIKARLVFENPKNSLKPGMTCNVRIQNSGVQQIVIPHKAIVEQMGEFFVYVIEGNKAIQREVTLGNKVGEDIIVKDGLKPNDIIATEGTQKLRDGATVQTGPSNKATK